MILIFVEGKGDDEFLKKYIQTLNPNLEESKDFQIIKTNGWTRLSEKINLDKFEENTRNGGQNLIIFDADNLQKDAEHGGFALRKKKIDHLLSQHSIKAEIFLFPNNQDDEDFEFMLEKIVNQNSKGLLACFEAFQNCVNAYKGEDPKMPMDYEKPMRKAKIYAYLSAFKRTNREAEIFKNKDRYAFDNTIYWDLQSPYLENIQAFLTRNMSK